MSNQHNLDADVPEHFEFILDSKVYKMRYPTTEEILEADKLDDEKKTSWMYSFISSDDKEALPIKDALAKKNIKLLQRFNQMIETEFTVAGA